MVLTSGAGDCRALDRRYLSEIHMRIPSRVIGGALIATLLTQLTACGTCSILTVAARSKARSTLWWRPWMP